ncbi:MAG: rhodanese-like domain-containing protein [Nitrospiraceae bacterium]|nr:rhodanese-like domain-containing protein [Nitrospiraceae bacterium]
MLRKGITCLSLALVSALTIGPALAEEKAPAPAAPAAAQPKPTVAKVCANCHQPQPGSMRGNFDSVAYKTQSIQIKIDDATEILRFDENLKIENLHQVAAEIAEQPLRALKKGKEVRIEYTEKDGKKFASALIAKPPIKIAPEKQVRTEDVEKLVAMGPEKGKYLLIDARPLPRFQDGSIATAVNIPFPAFDKMKDKLPADKASLIVYYCAGIT